MFCEPSHSNLFNDPCHIETEHGRMGRPGMRCFPRADFDIERIHTAGGDHSQNLIRSELRARKLNPPKLPS
jgi:hypothetical protein